MALPRVPANIDGPVGAYLRDLVRALERDEERFIQRDIWKYALLAKGRFALPPLRVITRGAALLGTIVSHSGLVPAGVWPWGVFVRVIQPITGPTSVQVGTPLVSNWWGTLSGLTPGSWNTPDTWVSPQAFALNTSPTIVRITAVGGNFTAGFVEITSIYLTPFLADAQLNR